MDRKKWIAAILLYRAWQNSRVPEPSQESGAGPDGREPEPSRESGGGMSMGCMVVCFILGMLLAALFIRIFS